MKGDSRRGDKAGVVEVDSKVAKDIKNRIAGGQIGNGQTYVGEKKKEGGPRGEKVESERGGNGTQKKSSRGGEGKDPEGEERVRLGGRRGKGGRTNRFPVREKKEGKGRP